MEPLRIFQHLHVCCAESDVSGTTEGYEEVWALSSECWVLCGLQSGHWWRWLDGSSSLFLCPFPFSRNLSHQNLWSQGLTGNPGAQPDWEWLRSVIREHSGRGGVLNPHFNSCIFPGRKGLEMHVGFSTLHRHIARWKPEEVLSAQINETNGFLWNYYLNGFLTHSLV